jgi:hypothetical protein
VLGFWGWLVDEPVRVLAVTRFGDWFLETEGGVVKRLSILEGTFEQVCLDAREFETRKSRDDELLEWFQDGMVYSLYRSGLIPRRGQGFGYRVPPILGGPMEKQDIVIVEMASWQFFMAQVHDQVRGIPAGARITRLEMGPEGRIRILYES